MTISTKDIKRAVKEALAEEAKDNEVLIQPLIIPPLKKQSTLINNGIKTQGVIDSFFSQKTYKGVKDETFKTYKKAFKRFATQFPILPLDTAAVRDYVAQHAGGTGRYKRNQHDNLNLLYKHAVRFFGIPENPMDNLERPTITHTPIRTLSLGEVRKVDEVIETVTERAVWHLTVGHGWRQIEVRRVTAGDVRSISDGIIRCRGKEREEGTPLLPETHELLERLAVGLLDDESVIRSTRIRGGTTQPLGASGIFRLIRRLFRRAGIKYMGHDLRRTFCTLVRESSGDEFLAMRLARDKIPGVNDRYINTNPIKLRENLLKHSPLRLLSLKQEGESLVETGESRTPRPEEAAQDMLQV